MNEPLRVTGSFYFRKFVEIDDSKGTFYYLCKYQVSILCIQSFYFYLLCFAVWRFAFVCPSVDHSNDKTSFFAGKSGK